MGIGSACGQGSDEQHIRITVEDDGVGLPADWHLTAFNVLVAADSMHSVGSHTLNAPGRQPLGRKVGVARFKVGPHFAARSLYRNLALSSYALRPFSQGGNFYRHGIVE
jgi:hypothetical protein